MWMEGTYVGGDVQLFDNPGVVVVKDNRVAGNLQCTSNRRAPNGGGNRVSGNKEDQCRSL